MSVESALVATGGHDPAADGTTRRMAIAWQNPFDRLVSAVGILEFDGEEYRFQYLRAASDVPGFRSFVGFPNLSKVYQSKELFPLFAQRAMSPRRPDYSQYLHSLALDESATVWEQLARTEGIIAADTIQLVPEPSVDTSGHTTASFLVAGIRHCLNDVEARERVLADLKPNDVLYLLDEPTNDKNPRAILTTTTKKQAIGWVPNMLLGYVHDVRDHGPVRLIVRHANGPQAPLHMRVLVEFSGSLPVGYVPFSGPDWAPYE